MICAPAQLPELFAEMPVPAGPISTEAADAIARLLWSQAERDDANQEEDTDRAVQPPIPRICRRRVDSYPVTEVEAGGRGKVDR